MTKRQSRIERLLKRAASDVRTLLDLTDSSDLPVGYRSLQFQLRGINSALQSAQEFPR